jgi:hypothetical protein
VVAAAATTTSTPPQPSSPPTSPPPPYPPILPDPPPPLQVDPKSSAATNPNPPNPQSSSVRESLQTKEDMDPGSLGGFDLSHLWKRSSAKRCGKISVPAPVSSSHSSRFSAPLGGARHLWSTLGGDTRSFAQVQRCPPPGNCEMEGRSSQGAERPPQGGGRFVRCQGDQGQFPEYRGDFRPRDDRRGNLNGGRHHFQHWRQRDQERDQLPLRENLK